MEPPLSGWRILVTGGGRRIGATVCRALAAHGATVGIHFRHSEHAALQLCREIGRGAFVIRGNLAVEEERREVFEEAVDWMGGLDALVNNAALFVRDNAGEAALAEMEQVNVEAPRRLMQWAEQAHVKQVVNLVDARALTDVPDGWGGGFQRYLATKRELVSLSRNMAAPTFPVAALALGAILPPDEPSGVPKGDDGAGLRVGPEGVAAEVIRLLLEQNPLPFRLALLGG